MWKERQKNSDAFRESLNNRACFSYLSYFHGTCNIFQPCSGCAGLPGHTLPSGLRRGNTVQKHNEPRWLYFKMSFIMECSQSLPFFACVACYVSYEFAAFDAKGIVALVNSHKEALKRKNFQQVQSIRSKLCVWKAIYPACANLSFFWGMSFRFLDFCLLSVIKTQCFCDEPLQVIRAQGLQRGGTQKSEV